MALHFFGRRNPDGNDPVGRGASEPRTARDIEILEGVVNQYWAVLVAYASRLLGDVSAAEDVVQTAFVRLWDRSHVLPPDDELRPYLYRIVRNLVHNEWRRTNARAKWLDGQSQADLSPLRTDANLELLELEDALERALQSMPARRREIFVLSRFHDLSNGEIAKLLDISQQTVANTLVAALRDLKQLLASHLDAQPTSTLRIVRHG